MEGIIGKIVKVRDEGMSPSVELGAKCGAVLGANLGLVGSMELAGMVTSNPYALAGMMVAGIVVGGGAGIIPGAVVGKGLEEFSNGVITVVGMTLNSLDNGASLIIDKTEEKIEFIKDKIKSIRNSNYNSNKNENSQKIKLG